MKPLQWCAVGVVEPAPSAAAGLGRWLLGMCDCFATFWSFQLRKFHTATTVHRALPLCPWPALGMPWATARSNAASAACGRWCGACTGGGGRGAVQVVRWGCGFAGLWRFLKEEAAFGNHSAQSPTSVSGQPWACHRPIQGQMQPLQCAGGVVEP